METSDWEELLRESTRHNPLVGCRAIAAYNEVIDKIHVLSADEIGRLGIVRDREIDGYLRDFDDFTYVLTNCMREGVALELRADDELFEALEGRYDFEPRIGGQAAIMGGILSRFSGEPTIIHPDRMDETLGSLLRNEKLLVPLSENETIRLVSPTEVISPLRSERHLIFEFRKGSVAADGEMCERDNRLIVCPMSSIIIDPIFETALPDIARSADLFVIAGLDHMGDDFPPQFDRVIEHVRTAKGSNPSITVHLEITCMSDRRKIRKMVHDILPVVDSVGLNEVELHQLDSVLQGGRSAGGSKMTPRELLRAMERLVALGVDRVQMHTLGYYLRVGRTRRLDASVRSLLFSSSVAAAAATLGRMPYPTDVMSLRLRPSEIGLKVLESLSDVVLLPERGKLDAAPSGNCTICVPTPVVERPKLTVGLGDCISSTAVACEKMLGTI